METVSMPKADWVMIKESLKQLKRQVKSINYSSEHFFNADEFVKLMCVTHETAELWRKEGKIGFSQEGEEIYYRMSDIERFLDENYKPPFARPMPSRSS